MPDETLAAEGSVTAPLNQQVLLRFLALARSSNEVSRAVTDAMEGVVSGGSLTRAHIFAAIVHAVAQDVETAGSSHPADGRGSRE